MRLVALQPAGSAAARQHYEDTILRPVSLAAFAADLGPDAAALTELYPTGAAPLWGATPGKNGNNVRAYERMSTGDYVLFASAGRVFAGATVSHTFRNPTVAQTLWGRDDKDQTWELMFAVDELRAFDIPYAELNAVVGYAPNNVIQGFSVLAEDKSAAVFDYLGLDSDTHPPEPVRADLAAALAGLGGETERTALAIQRLEQGLLRKTLLPGLTGECALCGATYPRQFLIAAHIKKRAACSPEERLDVPAVAMLACKFGCDSLFEEGYIGVADDGRLRISPLVGREGAIGEHLARLEGRRCSAHNASRSAYFAWHNSHTFKAGL